jgi:tetratricopeptide (TPR) repeat protein
VAQVFDNNAAINADAVFQGSTVHFHAPVVFGAGRPIERPKERTQRIFLSYARRDDHEDHHDPAKSFMRHLYNDLKDAGHDVWWDRESMPSRGLEFLPEIARAIDDCRRLVLVVGEHALKSDYVIAEWQYALQACIPIIPILRHGDFTDIPQQVGALHAPDFRPPDFREADAFDRACAELRRVLAEEDLRLATRYGVPALPPSHIERDVLALIHSRVLVDSQKPVVVTTQDHTTALLGVGGMGKSTLAAAFARSCAAQRAFPDGIFWLEMGKAADPLARMADVVRALNPAAATQQDVRAAFSALLAGKRALIVLDDVWDHRHAADFRMADAGCRLIVTTRKQRIVTNLDAEHVPVEKLSPREGLALIAQRLTKADHQVEPAGLPTECADIVAELDGHTLAVTIAAAILSERGLAYAPDLLRRLRAGRTFTDLLLDADDKDRNVERSLFLSYEDLGKGPDDDDLRRRFRALGVLAHAPFDRALAAALWGDDDPDDADDALGELIGAGLITRAESMEGTLQYSHHGLLRAYAHALLADRGEEPAYFSRYADFVIARAAAFDELPLEEWGELDPYLPHVDYVGDELARRWADAAKRDADLTQRAGDFTWNVMRYVYRRPQAIFRGDTVHMRGMNWLEMGLEVFRATGQKSREASTLNGIGSVYLKTGQPEEALRYYNEALPIRRAVRNRSGEAATLTNIGSVYSETGQPEEALRYHNEALPIRREVRDRSGEAATLHEIGRVYSETGEPEEALRYYNEALPILREVRDRSGEASTLQCIGSVYIETGKPEEALRTFNEALPIMREVRDRSGEATTLANIGSVYLRTGQTEEALRYYNEALPILREVRDRSGEAAMLHNIGSVYSMTGQPEEALRTFKEALPITREVRDRSGEAVTTAMIGVVLAQLGDRAQAIGHLKKAIKIAHPHDPNLPTFQRALADLKARNGQTSQSTLPGEAQQALAGNTVAVMTGATSHKDEWRTQLAILHGEWLGKGEEYAIEVVLVDALLAILAGARPALPDDNPYAALVQAVIEAIDAYNMDNPS